MPVCRSRCVHASPDHTRKPVDQYEAQ
jgi:hypothetical protein